MIGIILEIFRLQESLEVKSDFYLITDPFSEVINQISKAQAQKYIRENALCVAEESNEGRIYDTAARRFQKKWAVSELFHSSGHEPREVAHERTERKRAYKESLFSTIARVWGDDEEWED